ncbi:PIG-L family deacetylase [Aliiroseovarius sp. 2305UL8-7]|uniref:PIG-L family deacetylase n=1 Tax=Aliiroseovarius conchicola TaxID=3121637 RepID=UPI0035279A30
MPLTDQTRITNNLLKPSIVELWKALSRLQTVVSFMNTGAHPDDETSAMLAALGLRDGVDLSYACSTRGEGGQNDIGTEATNALGVLRTAEMERACDVLNMRMYWLSVSPDDTIFDFGFSKSGVETMGKWGRERTLKRFVDILRAERPDIICPTFLDIPGQHGHHRAMTEAAHIAVELAGDPAYTQSDLPVWQVKKLYLPAWSGAGQAYDDDLPPPPTSLTLDAHGVDPVTGWTYEQIGQQSRAYHKTQAMGVWVPAGSERDWPLHLAETYVDGPDETVFSGLPHDLRDLGLGRAQDHIDAARAAFPNAIVVAQECSSAFAALAGASVGAEFAHKLDRKRAQLAQVVRIATGVQAYATLSKDKLHSTDEVLVSREVRAGQADAVATRLLLPNGWTELGSTLSLKGAALSDAYVDTYRPDQPPAPCLGVAVTVDGVTSQSYVPFDVPPVVVPDEVVQVDPLGDVLNLASSRRQIDVQLIDQSRAGAAAVKLDPPAGWEVTPHQRGATLGLPQSVKEGAYRLPVLSDESPAFTVQDIIYDHIAPRAYVQPAEVKVQVIDVALPDVNVGYVGGGSDRVDHWLERMGFNVTQLSDDDLMSDERLAEFDSIVIGIFALKFRTSLAAQMPRLHAWVEEGGTLLTLYHRPWDNWDKEATPPEMIEIGQPSLRWRVTDENAAVTQLSDHPVLTHPNQISERDWQGWHKERGLYFAKSWAVVYAPLLEMADPGEAPHKGALLSADIGLGRHTHCALILHHQMEKLVPGAFRLMANLLAKRS